MSARERIKRCLTALPLPAKVFLLMLLLVGLLLGIEFFGYHGRHYVHLADTLTAAWDTDPGWNAPENVQYQPITRNRYSRPGKPLREVKGIVIHYVANPGSSAAGNRRYFAGLAISHQTYASSHFIVGLAGEVLQLIPLGEIAYCSNDRNVDTVSIECCHPDESGEFNADTYAALVQLVAALCREYRLTPEEAVIRHYDVTGKCCPKYYVEHEDAWEALLSDIKTALEK